MSKPASGGPLSWRDQLQHQLNTPEQTNQGLTRNFQSGVLKWVGTKLCNTVAPPGPSLDNPGIGLPKDPEKLVYFWVSMEEWFLGGKFSKDGTNTPDVYRCGITWGPQQDFRSSVPQSYHLCNQTVSRSTSASLITECLEQGEIAVTLRWDACMYLMCVHSDRDSKGTCEPKVCKLNYTFIINQQVLGL